MMLVKPASEVSSSTMMKCLEKLLPDSESTMVVNDSSLSTYKSEILYLMLQATSELVLERSCLLDRFLTNNKIRSKNEPKRKKVFPRLQVITDPISVLHILSKIWKNY